MQFKKAVEDGKEGHVSCTCGSIRYAALVIGRPPAYTLDRGEGMDFQEEGRESQDKKIGEVSGEEEKRLWAVIYRADGRSKVMGLDGCWWLLVLWKGREVKDPNPNSQW
jgi:hypothetical protein